MRMLRDLSRVNSFLREHTWVVGGVAAMVPLATLLALQVMWLTDLDRASAVARRAAVRNCLEAVGNELAHFYRSTSERLLNVPAVLFESGDLKGIAAYWHGRPREGVRRLFAVDYGKSATGNFYTFVPERKAMHSTPASDESLAIVLAALPLQQWAQGIAKRREALALRVSEQDPHHRIVLKPVRADEDRLVGVVGLVIDTDYVRDVLLERFIRHTVPTFFSDGGRERLWIRVRDGRGQAVFDEMPAAERRTHGAEAQAVALQMPFVLRDWTMSAISVPPRTRWANGSLGYNLTLGFVVAVLLIAGIVLVLLGARRAMRLSQMKSDFVSNVSHELRTPLASIRLFAEMMMRGRVQAPEKVIEYGTYIETESRRLSRLIDNILDFSRIESQQKEYRHEPTLVLDVVDRVLDAFDVRLRQAGLRLVRHLPERPGPVAQLDADAVGQALHNLLDNAAKYSREGEEIVVEVTRHDEHVVISVEDHGIGIAKSDQAKVFERFHRVSTGLVHDVKGSGLGLAIVQHTARAHGGRVTLESDLGVGSTFRVWLPVRTEREHGENSDCRG